MVKSIALNEESLEYRYILGMRVDATSYEDATRRIIDLAKARKRAYVCAANVNMTMRTYDSPTFSQIVNDAFLVTPDGMPLVWALGLLGVNQPSRVYGPTLTLHVCEQAAQHQLKVGLYGGTPDRLEAFAHFLKQRFPQIQIVCKIAPPFRPLTVEEDVNYTNEIVQSGAQILFVGIGCPKQEIWMSEHLDRIPAVMLGVGAAFDFFSGRVKQAPPYLQKMGLEWAFRLAMEPKRLWRRYVYDNPRFIVLFASQYIKHCFGVSSK